MDGLTSIEASALAECEAVIERGLATFVEVGEALLRIRGERLYRTTHKSFEDYCRERWGWSKTHINRQIQAAQVAHNLTPMGVTPATERQARELAHLTPEQQRQIVTTIDLMTATAAEIRQQVRGLIAPDLVYFEISTDQRDSIAFHPVYAYRDAVDFDFVATLAASIRHFGQFHPILTMPDRRTIIDGRHRFLACEFAGQPAWCRVWDGGTSAKDILEVVQILHETFKPLTKQERNRQFRDREEKYRNE